MKKILLLMLITLVISMPTNAKAMIIFEDDFSSGLGNWDTDDVSVVSILGNDVARLKAKAPWFSFGESYMWTTVDTNEFMDISFSYDRSTKKLDSLCFINFDKFQTGWRVSGASDWNILEDIDTNVIPASVKFDLPEIANDSKIDIGFRLENNNWLFPDKDYAFVDNVLVEGTHTPEPASMMLLGSGLLGLIGFRRKRLA